MDKASWIDAFVLQMIELGDKSPRLDIMVRAPR